MAEYGADESEGTTPPSFVLAPLNKEAKRVTEHVRNRYYQYPLDADNNTFGLWIDFSDPDRQEYTFGRSETDIFLPDVRNSRGSAQISDLHASFFFIQDTGAVLLQDHSEHRNTEPFAPSPSNGSSSHCGVIVKPRSSRSVLVACGINSRIAFGRDKFYQFEVQWRSDGLYSLDKSQPYIVGPRNSRTKKYVQGDKVGGGAYGDVYWVVDVTNGELMAVKKFRNLSGKNLDFATREVANLFKISKDKSIKHAHILEIFDYVREDNWGEIFMPLMRGNLKSLIEEQESTDETAVGDRVLRQMLLALDCIASHNIVHRDIKPENILWQPDDDGGYHFCLGDFGLSHDPRLARTVAGTEPFMAPEVFHRKSQTTKVDIWSLFATYIWIHNTEGFRDRCSQYGAQQIHSWLNHLATFSQYVSVRRMAAYDARKRPTASQQLAILDGGAEDLFADPGYDAAASDLANDFQGMNVRDDSYDPESSGSTMPDIPYYEPYTAGLYPPYDNDGQAGPSNKRYTPAPMGGNAPGYPERYIGTYDNTYGRIDDTDTATEVPDTWTQRPLPTQVEPGYPNPSYQGEPSYQDPGYPEDTAYPETEYRAPVRDPRRKQKGKHRS